MRSTRSKGTTRSNPHQTLSEQVRAIAQEAERQAYRQVQAQKAAERRAAEKEAAEEEQAEEEAQRQIAGSEDPVLDQSFDFEVQSNADSDTPSLDLDALSADLDISSMDLDPAPSAQLPPSTLTRLQQSSASADPSITFPFNRILPKAAVFLRCLDSHVFALPGQLASLSFPADSHAIAQVMSPCPQCVPPQLTTEIFCKRRCAFCMVLMPQMPDGRFVCLTQSCWYARCDVEMGTDKAADVWGEVWRKMGNRYFFVGPWEEVLSFSNDLDRDAEEKWAGGDFTV